MQSEEGFPMRDSGMAIAMFGCGLWSWPTRPETGLWHTSEGDRAGVHIEAYILRPVRARVPISQHMADLGRSTRPPSPANSVTMLHVIGR